MKKPFPFKQIIKVIIALAMILLVPITNYIVDPAGLFTTDISGSVEEKTVSILLSGHNAEGLVNYDERLIKRLCIYEIGKDTQVLALGSSRVALVDSAMVGNDSFFNLSVTGAALQDVIAMYGIAHMNGLTPQRLIIALDPWFVNSNYSSLRFDRVLSDGYCYYLNHIMGYSEEHIGYSSDVNSKYLGDGNNGSFFNLSFDMQKELFSLPYFQSSLSLVLDGNTNAADTIVSTSVYDGAGGMLRHDGSYSYPEDYRYHSLATITELAESQLILVDENHARIIGSEDAAYDDPNYALFCDFIESLVNAGVQVDLIMPPLNPILWDYMLQHDRYAPIVDSVDFFRDTAQTFGCRIVGSFNPHELGADAEDFYDGYHYKAENMAELVAMLTEVE